jgi:hypothetical protein
MLKEIKAWNVVSYGFGAEKNLPFIGSLLAQGLNCVLESGD